MEELLDKALTVVVPVVEVFGALVIVIEAVRTIVRYLFRCVWRECESGSRLRIRLGQAMVMGLEFQVAADILKTALAPSWNDMLLLASLIGLRTVLNYFLERELKVLDADGVTP